MSKKTKSILVFVAVTLLTALVIGVFSWATSGFRDWDFSELSVENRNPKNLISLADYDDDLFEKGHTTERGGTFLANGDGSITISQIEYADAFANYEDTTVVFAKVLLNPGTYTFTGAPKGSVGTYTLIADWNLKDADGEVAVARRAYSDFSGACMIQLENRQEVVLSIFIDNEYSCQDVTVYPVINEGKDPVDFYLD